MLEGRLPFEAASTEKLESIVRSHEGPRPLGEGCPRDLQKILYKALSHSAARRYASAGQFESDLRAFLEGRPTVACEESEETRRTSGEDDRETCRTISAVQVLPASGRIAVSVSPVPARGHHPGFSQRTHRMLLGMWITAVILLAGAGIWQGKIYESALQLRSELQTVAMDPDEAWDKYQSVRSRSWLGAASAPLSQPMVKILYDGSQAVFDDYRNSDVPKIMRADWIRCKRYAARAMEIDPSDLRAQAMFAYADGQIQRINRKDLAAVAAFQRAIQLDPKWPDPYLGMARTYIYNLQDVERGMPALQRAKDLGHSFGKRELAMTGDAFKTGGLQAWSASQKLRGTEQEKDLLKKCRENLRNAISAYSQIAPWGESTDQILQAREALIASENRLNELNPPNPPNRWLPWNWFSQ
jgi:hypothetical protein